jgi:hypothetical protein
MDPHIGDGAGRLLHAGQVRLEGVGGEPLLLQRLGHELMQRERTLGHVGGGLEKDDVSGHQRGRRAAQDLPQ